MGFRRLPSIEDCTARLELIFPRAAFDSVLSSPNAGAAVAAMLYVDAVVSDNDDVPEDARWVRPTTCLWLSDAAYARDDAESREAYSAAALGARAKHAVEALHRTWDVDHRPLYADNTRETLVTRRSRRGPTREPCESVLE